MDFATQQLKIRDLVIETERNYWVASVLNNREDNLNFIIN